jgi:chromosome segregation ATPase
MFLDSFRAVDVSRYTRVRQWNWESPLADSPSETNRGLVYEDSDLGDVDEALDELGRRITACQERISDLGGELKEAAGEEAETAQRLDGVRERRAALDQQLHEARKEATRLILNEESRESDVSSSSSVEEAAGIKIASEETAALVNERDRLAGEVGELANAVAAAQAAQAELSTTVESLRRERDETLVRSEQARADQGGAAWIMSNEAGRSIETAEVEMVAVERDEFERRNEELSDDDVERPTRYERASARLPSMGDDASEVIGSLEDLRKSLRRR